MPKFIIKLGAPDDAWYLEWSTISDAPATYGMRLDEFKAYYREQYGRAGMAELDQRLARVERVGTSDLDGNPVDQLLAVNRAGAGETCLSPKQILAAYCVDRRDGRALPRGHRHHDGQCEWGDA